jgi:hypothetical protein
MKKTVPSFTYTLKKCAKKQAFETLPLKNGIKLAVQEGWGATPFCNPERIKGINPQTS